MNIIIFSKNRPAQLELLLRSYKRFFKEWEYNIINILHIADKEYEEGYRKVIKLHPEFVYFPETSFKKDILYLLDFPHDLTALGCDDDVFIKPVSVKDKQFKQFKEDKDILCLNLRMGQNYNYAFDTDDYVSLPDFKDDTWEWEYHQKDWGYPMGTIFHIYRTKQIKKLLKKLKFTGPNTMEGQMALNPLTLPKMVCYDDARTVNIPLNLVQDVAPDNRAANISPESMNKKFMSGQIISLNNILTKKFKSCFAIVKPKWVMKE